MRLFGRPKQTVGLDIGSGLVKAVVVEHGGGAPELVRVAVTALADDAIVEGEVMDPAPVAEAVRETLDAAVGPAGKGGKPRRVVVAVGGRDVIVKRIRAARAAGAEARALLRWEAEQHVPFEMDGVALDFHVLDPEGDAPEMTVLLAAAKRELVDAKLRLLDDAGVAVDVVDVEAFALHNAFGASGFGAAGASGAGGETDGAAGLVALANVGHETTTVNVLEDGVPVLTRDLAVGVRRIREDLQRALALSSAAADALLRGERQSPQLAPVVARHAEELADGVERAAAQLESIAPDAGPLRALFLCGGGARVPGLAAAAAARLRVRVEQANPLAGVHVRDGALDGLAAAGLDADALAPMLMLPLGLALRRAA